MRRSSLCRNGSPPRKWAANLRLSVNDDSNITEELIRRKTDYWNVIGRDREGFIAMANV